MLNFHGVLSIKKLETFRSQFVFLWGVMEWSKLGFGNGHFWSLCGFQMWYIHMLKICRNTSNRKRSQRWRVKTAGDDAPGFFFCVFEVWSCFFLETRWMLMLFRWQDNLLPSTSSPMLKQRSSWAKLLSFKPPKCDSYYTLGNDPIWLIFFKWVDTTS